MDFKGKSKEELDKMFAESQEQITVLQQLQAEIASERRQRRFEVEVAMKRAELKVLEEKLSATG